MIFCSPSCAFDLHCWDDYWGVKKDWLKVLLVPFFPLALMVFDEEISMSQLVIEVHCMEQQVVESLQLENMVVLVIESFHEQVVVVLLILIAF